MSGILMMVIAIVVLGGAYLLYGRYLQNKWGIDPNAKTPAYEMEDGVDYVPADTNVVFGHQFASIAGAGPINGPIQAAIFGWLPVLLWILIGGVFFTTGAIIYALKKPDPYPGILGFHEIFHLFVLLGSFSHFWMIYKYIAILN